MNNLLQDLQETLLTDIPITRHLGIKVDSYDGERLTLTAPLVQNVNHKQTAFAGSLNAVITLAGWGLLWLILKELDITGVIVIQDSATNYLLPVTDDFSAHCYKPDQDQITKLKNMLKNKGKARLELKAEIREGEKIAVSFKGRYVVCLSQHLGEEEFYHA
ncbi:MAG: thioesterase domain-containing protein [Chloroflexi bacterium]|nr:thioesterase domain-containing protein [Chloroflexota bacterium]